MDKKQYIGLGGLGLFIMILLYTFITDDKTISKEKIQTIQKKETQVKSIEIQYIDQKERITTKNIVEKNTSRLPKETIEEVLLPENGQEDKEITIYTSKTKKQNI